MSKTERKRRFERAESLARDAATQWRVYRKQANGAPAHKPRLVDALSEREALRKVRKSFAARPVLPSSTWRQIYAEVGLTQAQ